MNGTTRAVVLILVVALPVRTIAARSAEDRRELQGRALFAKEDYKAALEVYANLFAEKGDPIYLRNIGRCYQNLEEPQKAIKAFREYLRRGHVDSGERVEVEGFIKDMEDLEKQKAATAPPPVEPVPAPVGSRTDDPATHPPVGEAPPPQESTSSTAPGALLTTEAPAPEESTSLTSHWWFWTGLAVLAAGGAAAAIVFTRPHAGAKPPCPLSQTMGECP